MSWECLGVGSGGSKELALKAAGRLNVLPFWFAAIARGTVLVKRWDRASQHWLKGFYNDNSENCRLEFPSVKIMFGSLTSSPTHSCTLHKYNKNRCLDAPLGNKGSLIPDADYFLLHLYSQKKKNQTTTFIKTLPDRAKQQIPGRNSLA